MQRAVLDTNVIVSGTIIPSGSPAIIIDAWREGRFSLVTSEAIIDEVKRVLNDDRIRSSYPKLKNAHVGKIVNLLRNQSVLTPGNLSLSVVERDPDDDKFVVAAVEGRAQFIVSGDQDLLSLNRYESTRILTPAEFLKRI